MELVYMWIMRDEIDFIKEQGFNFYGEHYFSLDRKGDKWRLSYEDRSNKYLGSVMYKGTGISNITAIVGENGSGKTSLLNAINDLNFNDEKVYEGTTTAQHEKLEKEKGTCMAIYRDKEGRFTIYHTFPESRVDNGTDFKMYGANDTKQGYFIETGESSTSYSAKLSEFLNSQTIINLSNSSFAMERGISADNLNLIATGFDTIARLFYKKLLKLKRPTGLDYISQFVDISDFLIESLTGRRFQQLCDVVYYHKLLGTEQEKLPLDKIKNKVHIQVDNLATMLHKKEWKSNKYGWTTEDKEKKWELLLQTTRSLVQLVGDKSISNLIFNLCWEILYYYPDVDDVVVEMIKYHQYYLCDDCIEGLNTDTKRVDLINKIEKLLGNKFRDGRLVDYYIDALKEICVLEQILLGVPKIPNTLMEEDMAYKCGWELDFTTQREVYIEFCGYINDLVQAGDSFVLKYININEINMSSGERAVQNYFSWIYMLPEFQKIMGEVHNELRVNMLVLIDEIDLYVHPDWQRKMIYYIIERFRTEFKDMNIQIILTTHSPLVLSDIPKENVILLKTEEGKFKVIDKEINTFASNTYKLLKDGFFMESTMGELSQERIKMVIEALERNKNGEFNCIDEKGLSEFINKSIFDSEKYSDSNVEGLEIVSDPIAYIKTLIASIGEDIIRVHLEEKLVTWVENCLGREALIKEYKRKIAEIENMISEDKGQSELRGGLND